LEQERHKLEVWQENLKVLIDEYCKHNTRVHLAKVANVSPALITKYLKPGFNNPQEKQLRRICEALGTTIEQLYQRKGENGKVGEDEQMKRVVFNRDLRAISDWLHTQEEPDYIAKTIRFMVEQNYPDFKEWQKMQKKSGEGNDRKNRAASANGY